MIRDTEKELERIFMSYKRALENLKLLNIKTKNNKEININDLTTTINVMNRLHPACRWKCKNPNSRKHYILSEGFYWLLEVYYQRDSSLVDADINFFIKRIKMYEDFLHLSPKTLWLNDMYVSELEKYFNRKPDTIRKAILKMIKINKNYRFIENGKYKISKEGVEWLCENCFKHKYLELLEEYKMELTKKYIEAGYPYDIFLFQK